MKVGDKVWLIDRNADLSRSIRKSGRGIPCRHRYEVTGVSEFGVRVTSIDVAPKISEWQPLHKVGEAFPDYNDDDFSRTVHRRLWSDVSRMLLVREQRTSLKR